MSAGNPIDVSGIYSEDLDKRRKQRCGHCWWREGGRCWNDGLGPVPRNAPAFSGLNGHEITHDHLAACVATNKGALSPAPLPDRKEKDGMNTQVFDEDTAAAVRRAAEQLGLLLGAGRLSNGQGYQSLTCTDEGMTLSLNYYDSFRGEREYFGHEATLTWSEFMGCGDIVGWAAGEEARDRSERKAGEERREREMEAEEEAAREADRLDRQEACRAYDLEAYGRIKAELEAADPAAPPNYGQEWVKAPRNLGCDDDGEPEHACVHSWCFVTGMCRYCTETNPRGLHPSTNVTIREA